MPVIIPVSVLLGSMLALVFVIARRFRVVKKTLLLQNELEESQKKLELAQQKKNRLKENAIKELKRASEMKHKALRNLGAINELMKKADQDLMSENYEEAQKTLIQVLSLDENNRKANELIARLYLNSNQDKKAELIYKKLIDLYPFAPNYYSNLGHSFYQRRQFKIAARYYERAVNLDRNNPHRYTDLGNIYATKKDFPQALEYYSKAHRLNVRDINLMFLIVDICLQNTDPITAREYLHKILDYEPYNQQAKTLLGEVLRSLKETV